MDKKTYYISVGNGEISQVKTADTYSFAIQATEEEIIELREYFDQAYREDLGSLYARMCHMSSIIMILITIGMTNNYKKHISLFMI